MSARTTVTRLRDKQRYDRRDLDAFLDDATVGHFGIVDEEGRPVVFATAVVRDGDRMLAHGSTGSPWMRRLATGVPTCLTVTLLDGLVVARSAFESSLHYRSATLFGSCSALADEADKARALDLITEALLPGRSTEIRPPNGREIAATQVLALPIAEWSLKVSDKWPTDEPEDVAGDAWAGVIPLVTSRGQAKPAPDLRAGIELPPSVRASSR